MPFVYPFAHIIQKLGFLLALIAEIHFIVFIVPMLDFRLMPMPSIDRQPMIEMSHRTKTKDTFLYKFGYNMFLMSLLFL